MVNITYLPANDAFHAAFRMFVLFPEQQSKTCPHESTLILDFYVCFPTLISEFRSPKPLLKMHNALKRQYLPNTYQITPNHSIMFHRMRSAQTAALSSLQAYGFFDPNAFKGGIVARTAKELPERIGDIVETHRRQNAQLIAFLDELKDMTLYGPTGLRARSGLGEYRYDNV